MDFSPHVDKLLKPFIKSFGKCEKVAVSKKDLKTYNSILISLYNDIYSSNKTIFNTGCFKSKVVNISTEKHHMKNPTFSSGRYFPPEIQTYIKKEQQYQLIFSCGNVGGRDSYPFYFIFKRRIK